MGDNPAVNQPSSGTYGEKADLNRLKDSLPTSGAGPSSPATAPGPPPISPEPITPVPNREGRPATGAAPPPGIPSVLALPTQRPDVPVNTPLAGPPAPPFQGQTPSQARLALLDMLSSSPDVSNETREWATTVRNILLGGVQGTPITPSSTGV